MVPSPACGAGRISRSAPYGFAAARRCRSGSRSLNRNCPTALVESMWDSAAEVSLSAACLWN